MPFEAGAKWSFSSSDSPADERAASIRDLHERGILHLEPLPNVRSRVEITKWEAEDASELPATMAAHVADLVALIAGADRGAPAAEICGVRAARLQAAKSDICRNLGDGGLSVAAVAARQGVTPRYIHKLFESEGATFSEYVLARRLSAAHRLLTNRRLADRSIASVAFDSGFTDLSYFNRTFRRRYGATPTDARCGAELR